MPRRCSMPMAPSAAHSSPPLNVMCAPDAPRASATATSASAKDFKIAGRSGPGAASRRGPVTGVKGTQHCSFG
jgi:hypothetical protein